MFSHFQNTPPRPLRRSSFPTFGNRSLSGPWRCSSHLRTQRESHSYHDSPTENFLIFFSQNVLSSRPPDNNHFLDRTLARRRQRRDEPSYLDAIRQRWFQEIAVRVRDHGMFEGVVDHLDELGVGTKEGGESRPRLLFNPFVFFVFSVR